MTYQASARRIAVLACSLFVCTGGYAQQTKPATHQAKAAAKHHFTPAAPDFQAGLEPKAIDILKSACARLAAARSMSFRAVVSYESPSRLGPPLVYSTNSLVTMQRPDKLKVVTLADGPPSDFYYDGKTMTAYAPTEKLVAVTSAPPTIDAALAAAFTTGAIYFPFTDVIVADPYKDIADGLKIAFYIGQSSVVGATTTDMVAYVTGDVFVQIWIGTEDKLPRRIYAVYLDDPARLRHVLELSEWSLDVTVAQDAFTFTNTAGAAHIAFARPDAPVAVDAPGMKPPPGRKISAAQ
ncbi:DUF2092 domain-containing protein [Caballeronia insecticola]|uniref:Periplasmic protein-like protein n=1 Tax=Caballeronia insecticola TaxID=758793 RepID=R4X4S0_9BURK|nr:DUF2092 domain-containing protein [Caballeronia insecticola]BAN27547.1 periplasmic protein-like protein [Caballeronia insecticola]